MSSIESVILDLLEKSSLPGIYKVLISGILPDMSRIQQEELLKILFADQNNIKELEKKKMAIYRKYAPMIDSVLADPDSVKFDPMILNISKDHSEKDRAEKMNLKLDTLKNSLKIA